MGNTCFFSYWEKLFPNGGKIFCAREKKEERTTGIIVTIGMIMTTEAIVTIKIGEAIEDKKLIKEENED